MSREISNDIKGKDMKPTKYIEIVTDTIEKYEDLSIKELKEEISLYLDEVHIDEIDTDEIKKIVESWKMDLTDPWEWCNDAVLDELRKTEPEKETT